MATLKRDVIFTNVALTDDGDVWWEGMTDTPPAHLHRLAGQGLDAADRAGNRRARPRIRTRASRSRRRAMPVDRPALGRSGGRADRRLHLRRPALEHRAARRPRRATGPTASTWPRRWARETTAAAAGQQGVVRRDPFAMLPFCGYNMSDYFGHWLDMGEARSVRREAAEDLLRQLVPQGRRRQVRLAGLRREHARAEVDDRPRRRQRPAASSTRSAPARATSDLDWNGIDFTPAQFDTVIGIDRDAWRKELELHAELFEQLAHHLPPELTATRKRIEQRLSA